MLKKIVHMRQPDPEQPLDRQQKKEMQVKPQFGIGKAQFLEAGVKIQKIEQPFVLAGVNDTGVFVQSVDFFQVVIVQIDFSNRTVQDFPGDMAVIARVQVGEIIGSISQQIPDGPVYSGPDPGDQGFEKLEKVHE
jgi:hypothetical protein